ncbi:hypothetical protein PG993_004187 [Apiospora rasikravindrae]|uniref:DUF4470 domain-containing protein n=1 Tax=Apiospora rasikravindrae TaxID=990691 RepID=A0ABR1TER1_9PEZI
MASTNVQKVQTARLRDIGHHKMAKLIETFAANSKTNDLDSSNPSPYYTLCAAYFEAGDYRECIGFANKALGLLDEVPDSDSQKQKLFIMMANAMVHSQNSDALKPVLEKIATDGERNNFNLALKRLHAIKEAYGSDKSELMAGLMKLPRTDEADYFCVGQDVPKSQLTKALIQTLEPDETASIMFCGIGDGRHLFQTILDLKGAKPRNLYITIIDHNPAVIARDLILLHLLNEAITVNNEPDAHLFYCTMAYLYTVPVIPPFAWERLQITIAAILDKFAGGKQPISWVFVPAVHIQSVCRVLRQWQPHPEGLYSTKSIRAVVARNDLSGMSSRIEDVFSNDSDTFHDVETVTLPLADAEKLEPRLGELLRTYRTRPQEGRGKLSAYINRVWKSNVTMIDFDWQNSNEKPEAPDMSSSPFMTAEALANAFGKETHRQLFKDCHSIVHFIAKYFAMVEVHLDEMANALESMRYDHLQRPESGALGGRPEPPRKFHVIHMSNIPDYVGGPLTSFLYGAPVLASGNGTSLTSCVLRNPPRWNSISQFLSEYLLMHDRDLIKTHFRLKLSRTTPEEHKGMMNMFPLLSYCKWERVGATPPPATLSFEELMPRAMLTRWLHAHFLEICLPHPRGYEYEPNAGGPNALVYAPLNLTIFMRLLVHVAELGYPAHWLSAIVNGLLNGEITTTARAPREPVLRPQDIDKVYPARKISVEPWRMEFSALVSLWQPVLPFGLVTSSSLATSSPLPIHEIDEISVKLPPDTDYQAEYYPHYMLVFWNQEKLDTPLSLLRPLLLDDEEGDKTTSARKARREVVRAVTTFRWSAKTKTATFWLHRKAMAEMVEGDWLLPERRGGDFTPLQRNRREPVGVRGRYREDIGSMSEYLWYRIGLQVRGKAI